MRMTQTQKPYWVGTKTLGAGKWLSLQSIAYVDENGQARRWESARRQGSGVAVQMIAQLQPSQRYILIEQYRPPVDAMVLEFPAGLVDADEDPAATAVRELYEETGYVGTVVWIGAPAPNSPGLGPEAVCLALLTVDETAAPNQNPQSTPEHGECIHTYLVDEANMSAFLVARQAEGRLLDCRLVAYFLRAGLRW